MWAPFSQFSQFLDSSQTAGNKEFTSFTVVHYTSAHVLRQNKYIQDKNITYEFILSNRRTQTCASVDMLLSISATCIDFRRNLVAPNNGGRKTHMHKTEGGQRSRNISKGLHWLWDLTSSSEISEKRSKDLMHHNPVVQINVPWTIYWLGSLRPSTRSWFEEFDLISTFSCLGEQYTPRKSTCQRLNQCFNHLIHSISMLV